jgi:glutamate carboxypeptidase
MGDTERMPTQRILEYMSAHRREIVEWTRTLVEIESPTHNKAAVDRAVDYVAGEAGNFAEITRYGQAAHGDHLRIEFDIPNKGDGQILGMGHLDTVWELGTLDRMPWREQDGRLWGPGVFDMKAGVAYFVFAAKALRDLNITARRKFVVQLNSDEEIGSPTSKPFTEAEAKRSSAVLVAEPSAGLEGSLKTSRKGGGSFRIQVRGQASHAGLDFAAGASAVVELARQIERIASWTDLESGVTVNPGVIRGGTASNVVAEEAWCDVDVRTPLKDQALELEQRFFAIKSFDERCDVKVDGGLRRLPLERTVGVVRLFELAKGISNEMGVDLGEASVGGGSDGNTTAALGIPTLDGLGAVGEGAHALNESILIDRIADRATLIAELITRL